MDFKVTIKAEELSRGLRSSKRMPRENKLLTSCAGAVGINGTLVTLKELARRGLSSLDVSFPYPQIFVFDSTILVCTSTDIYEWNGELLVKQLTVTTGLTWRAVDFKDYIYLSNNVVAVVKNRGLYTTSNDMPISRAMCNMNGQIVVGGSVT